MSTDSSVLITGAASGIGRMVVSTLQERFGRILATDVDEEALRAAATEDGWRVDLAALDVRRTEDWERALDRLGSIGVLVHVAGVIQPRWLVDVTDPELDHQLDVNLKGTILGVRAAARRMVAQGHGHLVLVNSLTGIAPSPGMSIYSASKFGARGFALAVAQELRPRGVFVTVICPDGVQTPMTDFEAGFEEAALTFSAGHMLSVEDVANGVVVALEHKPVELCLPWSRGALSKVGGLLPGLALRLTPGLVRRGRRNQQKRKEGHHEPS